MPRSSGGGSHSGSYHSSGSSGRSSSSYSSGGGSHSSGYSSSRSSGSSYSSYSYGGSSSHRYTPPVVVVPTARVSRDSFEGARKYVYYKDNQPQYYYSDYETDTLKRRKRLKVWIPVLVLVLLMIIVALKPRALSTDYDSDILINDRLGVIDDEGSLLSALEAFRDETGITPCIITTTNDRWEKHYDDLASFAFDVYVNTFEDERHWLLMYSQPEDPDPEFDDWYWEGVQGDDTVYILTEDSADEFGMTLQKYLTRQKYTVGEAFTKAFDETTPDIMSHAAVDSSAVLGGIILMVILIWIAIRRTGIFKKAMARPASIPAQAVPVKPRSIEVTCEYCGGVYLTDKLNCPHCGAGRAAIQ